MKDEGRAAVFEFADVEAQLNSALTGENKEYVDLVLRLIRDEYREEVKRGKTVFVLSPQVTTTLNEMKPW